VLLPIMFIVVAFARIEQGRLAAAQAARDAVRAAVEAPTATDAQQAADDALARTQIQTGVPLQLQLQGTFARGAVLRAETSAQIGLASLPFIGQLGTITVRGKRRRPGRCVSQPRWRQLTMNRAVQTRLRGERGSVLISGMLLTLALLMVLGAAVDIGHAFIVRRDLSSLADGAALAGAQQLDQQAIHQGQLALDPQQAQAAALSALERPARRAGAGGRDSRASARAGDAAVPNNSAATCRAR